MQTLYYAYGSNMSTTRLCSRIPSARTLGAARLRGWRWVCNKLGSDGTAKANLEPHASGLVWGVLWRIDPDHWDRLDRFEGGYRRVAVTVQTLDGAELAATTYASDRLARDPFPSDEYLRWLVEGAREHALPPEWIEGLVRLPTGAAWARK